MSLVHMIPTGEARTRALRKVQFGIMSPEKILEESVCHVFRHITKGSESQNTLMDPRLGATRTTRNAITGLGIKTDPGLFGHCVLAAPVYHPLFVDYVRNIIKCVCVCGNLRIPESVTREDIRAAIARNPARPKRLTVLAGLLKGAKKCGFCDAPLPNVVTDNEKQVIGLAFEYASDDTETAPAAQGQPGQAPASARAPPATPAPGRSKGKKGKKEVVSVTARKIYEILKRISDEDSELMGFNPATSRPEWMMITHLPIPPPTVRPSVIADNDKTSDDDLTQILHVIIKLNNQLTGLLQDKSEEDAASTWRQLQLHVAALIDNETNAYLKVTNRAHRPLKTIKGRHKGKPGRMRSNLQAKRTDHSARTVITADPNLSISEVGVPTEIAMILTYPERVHRGNIRQLTTLVRRGPNVYPGANEIKKPGQNYPINLGCLSEADRKSIKLSIGTIVYRHMLNGDVVIFNRQPSLHKMNMMAHYARILPGRSFRLSVNVTEPYAADFDGDEMNLHFPQNEQSRREWEHLALSPTQFCSPQANKPIIGTVQDTMLAAYRASSEQVCGYGRDEKRLINISNFMYLVNWIKDFHGTLPPIRHVNGAYGWTTLDLLNAFMPPITIKRKGKAPEDQGIRVVHGHLIEPPQGQAITAMSKDTGLLGNSAGSLFHVAWNDLGPTAAMDLVDDMSRVLSQWFMRTGFSVGIKDLELPRAYYPVIEHKKDRYLQKAQELITALNNGEYTDAFRKKHDLGPRGLTSNNYEQFEADISTLLDNCRNDVQSYVDKHIDEISIRPDGTVEYYDNRFMSMVRSGSKGKPLNAVQIIGILGSQVISGSRPRDFIERRPNCFTPKDTLNPDDRGFVRNSFTQGLNPLEYMYHATAGREGVISTSIKTAETGYIQRKLVKGLEDVRCAYDGTVRLGNGAIVQMIYGGDGYDGAKIEKQSIDHIAMSLGGLTLRYGYTVEDLDAVAEMCRIPPAELDAEMDAVTAEVEQLRTDWRYLRARYRSDLPRRIPSVVNFDRLIESVQSSMGEAGRAPYLDDSWILKPSYVLHRVEGLKATLTLPTVRIINDFCMAQFFALLRSKLASKVLIMEKCYTKQAFDALLEEIEYKFHDGLIAPGEAIGVITAQSIGEPSTQMTLDSFHSTGAKVTVAGGVPRFKEILSLTKMKTPSVTIYLKGIPVPKGILDRIPEHFLPQERTNSLRYVDKYLLSLPYDEAKALKVEFTELYVGGDGSSDLSVVGAKSQFEHTAFSDIVARSELHYIASPDSDPCSVALRGVALPEQYWLLLFTLDKSAISQRGVDQEMLPIKLSQNTNNHNVRSVSIDGEEYIHVTMETGADMGEVYKEENKLLDTHLKGVMGIGRTTIRREPCDIRLDDGSIIQRDTEEHERLKKIMFAGDAYIVDTVGSNLLDILSMPNVDVYKTFTNDIIEIYNNYGIEMARKAIIREVNYVMTTAGASLDIRHIEVLADAMTSRGFLQKIDRYGARKGESGPLAMASFEETTSVLCAAAVYGQEDNLTGVSSNVMFGQFAHVGTNSFDLYMDEAIILKHAVKQTDTPMQDLNEPQSIVREGCKEEDFEFDFKL